VNIRLHLVPAFGDRAARAINQTDVLLWLAQRLTAGVPQSSLRLYFELLDTTAPKSSSSGTVDLDPTVAAALARHVHDYPPVKVEMLDATSGSPMSRQVSLLSPRPRARPTCTSGRVERVDAASSATPCGRRPSAGSWAELCRICAR
jgi:hypothetical protein